MRRPLALSATTGLTLALLVAGIVHGGEVPVFEVTVTKTDAPDPVVAGTNLTYTIELELIGGGGHLMQLDDTLPAGTTFVSFTAPGGWSASTPAVGGTGTVSASIADALEGTYAFTLVVNVSASVAGGTVLTNTAEAVGDDDEGRPFEASGSQDTTVQAAPAPSVQASIADAAMAQPSPANVVAALGFGALLIGSLGVLAVASIRRRAR